MAGILDWITEKAKAQYAKGAPYREAVGGLLQGDMNKVNQALSKSDLTPMDFATTFAPMGITAWHASPKSFNKFSKQTIGTGSGLDFGYGTYLSGNKSGAEQYLSAPGSVERKAQMYMQSSNNVDDAIKMAKKDILRYKQNASAYMPNVLDDAEQSLNILKDIKKTGNLNFGNMYKVDIPDENINKMLSWEKPISEQSDYVKDSINKLGNKFKPLDEIESKNVTGERLYRRIENSMGGMFGDKADPMASKMLQDIGLSGITYSDPVNRASLGLNYVVFDPETIKILERNGLLLP